MTAGTPVSLVDCVCVDGAVSQFALSSLQTARLISVPDVSQLQGWYFQPSLEFDGGLTSVWLCSVQWTEKSRNANLKSYELLNQSKYLISTIICVKYRCVCVCV